MFVVGDIDDKPITIKDYGQEGRQLMAAAATTMTTLQSIAMAMARWILILIPVLLSPVGAQVGENTEHIFMIPWAVFVNNIMIHPKHSTKLLLLNYVVVCMRTQHICR